MKTNGSHCWISLFFVGTLKFVKKHTEPRLCSLKVSEKIINFLFPLKYGWKVRNTDSYFFITRPIFYWYLNDRKCTFWQHPLSCFRKKFKYFHSMQTSYLISWNCNHHILMHFWKIKFARFLLTLQQLVFFKIFHLVRTSFLCFNRDYLILTHFSLRSKQTWWRLFHLKKY